MVEDCVRDLLQEEWKNRHKGHKGIDRKSEECKSADWPELEKQEEVGSLSEVSAKQVRLPYQLNQSAENIFKRVFKKVFLQK